MPFASAEMRERVKDYSPLELANDLARYQQADTDEQQLLAESPLIAFAMKVLGIEQMQMCSQCGAQFLNMNEENCLKCGAVMAHVEITTKD